MHRNEPNRGAIWAAALATYLGIAGISVVSPILPTIARSIGATAWQVELLITAYLAVTALGTIPVTIAAGRFGLKPVLIAGVLTVGVAALLASVSQNLVQLAALRGLWGLGNAAFFATALVIMVALAVNREWSIGLFEIAVGLGFATGPTLGGTLGRISWRLPLFTCGILMLAALTVIAVRLPSRTDPSPTPRPRDFGRVYRRPAFAALCAVTVAYNFVFFIVLGYTPLFLQLGVLGLGIAFTGWGVGLAASILFLGQRLVRGIGAVASFGFAMAGLLGCLVLFATSRSTAAGVVALVASGVCMGVANQNLTDLAFGLGGEDRRVTTGAFNAVRLGAAAPAPVLAGVLAESGPPATPYWLGAAVLGAGLVGFLVAARSMAAGMGEPLAFWHRRARLVEGGPEEALGEAF